MLRLGRLTGALDFKLVLIRRTHPAHLRAFSTSVNPKPSEGHFSEDLGTFGFARSPDGSMTMNDQRCPQQESGMEEFAPVGSMQLMAVPKRKVTPHRKGIRNGPKALKPAPLIMRCKSCGRVKLPHFFCCTGDKINEERDNSTK